MNPDADGCKPLAVRQVPSIIPEEVERFTVHALQAEFARSFDPKATLHQLRVGGEKTVVAVDIGGDKLVAWSYDVHEGFLLPRTELLVLRGDDGAGYLTALEELADRTSCKNFSVGISFAGPTDGTRLLAGPNLQTFIAVFYNWYCQNFANLFPSVVVANDAEAGIMAGALEAAKRDPELRNVIYVINGSGLGGAVLTGNTIYAAEPGHIQIEAKLNPFGQRKPCGMLGAAYVCIEDVAASKAGVEDIWFQQKGERRSGREIAAKYLNGDHMALQLYDNSALVIAHVIRGVAKAFSFPRNFEGTVVVGHGGIFQVPGYRERVCTILEKDLSCVPKMMLTKDFSNNACLDGAAIAAATSGNSKIDNTAGCLLRAYRRDFRSSMLAVKGATHERACALCGPRWGNSPSGG